MDTLLIILCIIAYLIIGFIVAMIEVRHEVKEYGSVDTDDCCYIGIGLFWPLALVLFGFAYLVESINSFFEWYGEKLKEGAEEK